MSSKGDSWDQHLGHSLLLISYKSVFARVFDWHRVSALESCKHIPPHLSFSTGENYLSSRTLASCPHLPSLHCEAGLPSAAHVVIKSAFQACRASVLQSIGERRQQSFAGGCVPKCGLIMGGSVDSWHKIQSPWACTQPEQLL